MECPYRTRPARPEDAERVAALCTQLGYPVSPQEIAERLGWDDRQAVFVAEGSQDEIVGCINISIHAPLIADAHAEIEALIVDEKHRGQRIGRLLVEQAETWACEQGCRAITVRSNIVRQGAHAFYETLGYRRVKTQHNFLRAL